MSSSLEHIAATWDQFYVDVYFTFSALSNFEKLPVSEKLLAPLRKLLEEHTKIATERTELQRRAIEADAICSTADGLLDSLLNACATSILALTDNKRDHELYKKLFSIDHEDVIELGVDGELPVATLIQQLLETDASIPEKLKSDFKVPLLNAIKHANTGIGARSETFAALGRNLARCEAWAESASAAMRIVARHLNAYADSTGLSEHWFGSFFTERVQNQS